MLIDFMRFIILGFVQGITEPIPVSSSGHLLIFKTLIDKGISTIDFDILATITNTGSLIAICLIFKDEILELFHDFFTYIKTKEKKYYPNFKYSLYIVVATIPAGIMGIVVTKLGMFDFLENNIKFVGVTLLITALFLFLIRNIKGKKEKKDITLKDAIIVGLFQVVALLPGISRSGATIVGGMTRNFTRKTAFKFSFLLYIPISVATMILGIKDLITSSLSAGLWFGYIMSAIVASIFTYVGTKWFKRVMEEGKLIYFVLYCLVVGTLIIIFL